MSLPANVRLATFVTLPLIAALGGTGHSGARSMLGLHVVEGGASREQLAFLLFAMGVAALVGTLAAAAVALATGPWIPLCAGAGTSIVCISILGVVPTRELITPAVGLGFAQGLFVPAIYAVAAHTFRASEEHLRSASMLLVYGGTGVGALVGPPMAAFVLTRADAGAMFSVCAALELVACAIALAAASVALGSPKLRAPAAPPPARAAHLAAALSLAVAGGLALLASSPAGDLLFHAPRERIVDGGELTPERLDLWLRPAVSVVASLLGAAVLALLHLRRARFPILFVPAAGAVLSGAGAILAIGSLQPPNELRMSLALAIMSVGAVCLVVLVSHVAGGLPYRLETAAVATWSLALRGPTLALGSTAFIPGAPEAGAIFAIVIGLGIAAAAIALRDVFPRREA